MESLNQTNLVITRGDDDAIQLDFQQADGTIFDFTGCDVWFTAKNSTDDLDAAAVIQVKIDNYASATPTVLDIPLPRAKTKVDPGSYACDIQILTPGSDKILTIFKGTFVVEYEVTDAASI